MLKALENQRAYYIVHNMKRKQFIIKNFIEKSEVLLIHQFHFVHLLRTLLFHSDKFSEKIATDNIHFLRQVSFTF